MWTIVGIIFALAASIWIGIRALRLAIRGARLWFVPASAEGRHPCCAVCSFDLYARTEDLELRCPECGADLTDAKKATRIIVPPRQRAKAACLLFTALALGCGDYFFAHWWTSQVLWRQYVPDTVLCWLERAPLPRVEAFALTALKDRISKGGTDMPSKEAIDTAATLALSRESGDMKNWVPERANFLDIAWSKGLLSEKQVQRYQSQMFPKIETHIMFNGRSQKGNVSLGVVLRDVQQGFALCLWTHVKPISMSVDGKPVKLDFDSIEENIGDTPTIKMFTLGPMLVHLAPGLHHVTIHWEIEVMLNPDMHYFRFTLPQTASGTIEVKDD